MPCVIYLGGMDKGRNLFQNDVLSGVVVVSNDNVIPYDVTTKDDMFYQVSCDFSGAAFNDGGRVIVTGGLVVG